MIVRFRVPVVNDLYSEWERELILWLIYNEGIMDRARMSATITGKTCPLKKNPKEIRPETIRLKAGRKSSVSNKDKKKAISTVRKYPRIAGDGFAQPMLPSPSGCRSSLPVAKCGRNLGWHN